MAGKGQPSGCKDELVQWGGGGEGCCSASVSKQTKKTKLHFASARALRTKRFRPHLVPTPPPPTLPQVKGKVNAVSLDKCVRVGVVFGDVISGVEAVNCSSVQLQVRGRGRREVRLGCRKAQGGAGFRARGGGGCRRKLCSVGLEWGTGSVRLPFWSSPPPPPRPPPPLHLSPTVCCCCTGDGRGAHAVHREDRRRAAVRQQAGEKAGMFL